MHFTGRTWRPSYEAHSVIIQEASGCTMRKLFFNVFAVTASEKNQRC